MTETDAKKALALIQEAITNNSAAPGLGALVNPAKDARYGTQLYRWLTLGRMKGWCRVWVNDRQGTFIGHLDAEADGGSAMVANLGQVTLRGNRSTEFSVTKEFQKDWKEITLDFWSTYITEGSSAFPQFKWR